MQSFSYKPAFSYGYVLLLVFGFSVGYYGATNQVDLAFRRLTILEAPLGSYVFMLFGVILVTLSLYNLVKWFIAKGKEGQITFSTSGISFPEYTMSGARRNQFYFEEVTELYHKSDEEGFSVVVYTSNGCKFEFDASYFINEKDYNVFSNLLDERCGKK